MYHYYWDDLKISDHVETLMVTLLRRIEDLQVMGNARSTELEKVEKELAESKAELAESKAELAALKAELARLKDGE